MKSGRFLKIYLNPVGSRFKTCLSVRALSVPFSSRRSEIKRQNNKLRSRRSVEMQLII